VFGDGDLCAWFLRFLEETRRDENLTCYQAVLHYQAATTPAARLTIGGVLVRSYLQDGALRQVNVDSTVRRSLLAIYYSIANGTAFPSASSSVSISSPTSSIASFSSSSSSPAAATAAAKSGLTAARFPARSRSPLSEAEHSDRSVSPAPLHETRSNVSSSVPGPTRDDKVNVHAKQKESTPAMLEVSTSPQRSNSAHRRRHCTSSGESTLQSDTQLFNPADGLPPDLFDRVGQDVYRILRTDCFPKFLRSRIYKIYTLSNHGKRR
jgi:Regulator of G protein signaling domain